MNHYEKTWLSRPSSDSACTIIAEIAQAHDGSLGMAHAYIDAAVKAGADAVKFQTHIAEAESTTLEPWRTKFSQQDKTRLDYWRRMEFDPGQWAGLKKHADDAGILFLSSPFSLAAVDLLKKTGVAGWKIASGEITNFPMLDAIAETGQPVMLSTGLSEYNEIDAAVERLKKKAATLAIFQCTTRYPSPPETIGLNVIDTLKQRYATATGLSDHSGTIFPALAAATHGVQLIEVHLAMSRDMFGPDVVASITPSELRQLVEGVRFIEKMNANPVDKTKVSDDLVPLRSIFLKSVVPVADMTAGTVLSPGDLTTKKPGTGIPASHIDSLAGKILARDVKKDVPLADDDIV